MEKHTSVGSTFSVLENGLIGFGTRDSIDIVTADCLFHTGVDQILVLHKKTPKVVSSNNIGDGFKIPLIYTRNNLSGDLDIPMCVSGVMSYVGFDEQLGKVVSYAYKYPKDDVEYLNEMCNAFALPVSAKIKDQLVVLEESQERNNESPQTALQMLSYIYGLILVYGEFEVLGEDVLSRVTVRFPLRETFLQVYESLQAQKIFLQTQGLFVSIGLQDMDMGQMVTVDISDVEILGLYASWLEVDTRKQDISLVIEYIHAHIPSLIPTLSNSVLKLVTK